MRNCTDALMDILGNRYIIKEINLKAGRIMEEKRNSRMGYLIREWIIPIATALVLAWIINTFVVFRIEVPTGSMIPTINKDDKIFVLKAYNKDNFKRGDILVFESEELADEDGNDMLLIKRLIGLPGEHVELINGVLLVDGVQIEEPYVVNDFMFNAVFDVPEDHLLFLGDNRQTSNDARYWVNPYISKDEVIGKGGLRIFPLDNIGFLK